MKFRTSVYATLLNPIFQSKEFEGSGGLMVEIIILIYIFFGFGVMCDKYLIPAIEKIKERLAGSTILALGSSISLIASNMNAVLLNKPTEFELGLTAILGAAIFEFTIGFAIGCMLVRKNYKISYSILARDILIYLGIILLLYFFLMQKLLDLTKSIILLSLWVVYMIYLIITSGDDNSDYSLVIINKNTLDKPEKKLNFYSSQKLNLTNNNDNPTNYSNACTLETQKLKEDNYSCKKFEKLKSENYLLSNVTKLRNDEKKILDNYCANNNNSNENIHNCSQNSNECNKSDTNNKSHSNCDCYNKKYFNISDVSKDSNNNNCNNDKNKISEVIYNKQVIDTKLNRQNDNEDYLMNQNLLKNENKIIKENEYEFNELEEQKVLITKKINIQKLNQFKHIYIKNLYLKLNSNQSLLTLFVKGFLKATAKPWEMLLDLFTPKSNEGAFLIIKFIIPLFFIWNFSEVELFILEKVMGRLKVPASFLGLTIMSWGNNAPDMYNVASAMAKGLVDLALNAAIASEIHNILLGLGLPWLVYNLTYSKPIEFQMNDLYAFTIFFFCVFVLIFLLALKFNRNKFDYKLAIFLIVVYLVFLILIFVLSFNIKIW